MGSADIDERPLKKRRFFLEEGNGSPQETPINDEGAPELSIPQTSTAEHAVHPETETLSIQPKRDADEGRTNIEDSGFDIELFESVVGHAVPKEVIQRIQREAGNDVQNAVNIYLDGGWDLGHNSSSQLGSTADGNTPSKEPHNGSVATPPETAEREDGPFFPDDLASRYIGAFGAAGWATRSGTNLIQHGELLNIERTKIQPTSKVGRGGKIVSRQSSHKGDVLTRFTNRDGAEIGRLPQETAQWVSTLIDQKICEFTGVCVYAPDRIRVNDTIYIQLKCYLLRDAFQKRSGALPEDEPATGRLFEQQETTEEKALRLRQVALVTFFNEINLTPTSNRGVEAEKKKEGLLRAAELADEKAQKARSATQGKDGGESSDVEEGEELEKDQLDTLYQKAQKFDFNTPETRPPESFTMELRKYQKQALHWMLGKEKDVTTRSGSSMHPLWEEYIWPEKDVDGEGLPRLREGDKFYVNPYSGELSLDFPVQEQNCLGGILADEMGLGKTIEMLSLIHSHQLKPDPPENSPNPSPFVPQLVDRNPRSFRGPVAAPHTTLVVAPTSLLSQWESEAMKASKSGSMKVLVYYGNDKAVDLRNLCGARNATEAPNLVVTSYGIVRSEHGRMLSNPGRVDASQSGLFSVEFLRIILDEAHVIKNRSSKTARACCDLSGVHRWVLTGTPIVNRLEDLYSLVRFLKVEPWSNFSFWKTFITVPFESKDFARALNVVQTVLEPLVLRRTKTMRTPDGEALVPLPSRTVNVEEVELPKQEREIYDVIFNRAKRAYNDNVAAGTLLKSYTTIFTQLLRLRQTCCHPVLTRNQDMVADEEDAAVAADAVNNFKDDMDLQELISKFTASTEEASKENEKPVSSFTTHALKQIQTESQGECPICAEEPMINPAVSGCWHSACKDCLESYIRHQMDKHQTPRCFSCREDINTRDIFEVVRHPQTSIQQLVKENTKNGSSSPSSSPPPRISLRRVRPLSPSAHTSAKIQALIDHLAKLPPNEKAVVFSQFTSFLDLIAPQLTRAGISHLRFDGTMHQKARAAVLAQFHSTDTLSEEEVDDDTDNPKRGQAVSEQAKLTAGPRQSPPNVLLISLRAGGVGLNLTSANHVFMMDPWWSFAVEAQAIDRVHRMGQFRDVSVTRFVVKDSIEGRMLRVQERKMMIAGTLGLRVGADEKEEDKGKERIEELKMLFE